MLAKLGWLILTRPDELWVQVLRSKYGDLLSTASNRNTSALWRHIKSTVPLIVSCIETTEPTSEPPSASDYRWKPNSSGKFTVASTYEELTTPDNHPHDPAWARLWCMKGPSRLNFLLWQSYRNLLPTAEFLYSRHIQQDGRCSICKSPMEDTMHALRNCQWARDIWKQLVRSVQGNAAWQSFLAPQGIHHWIMENIQPNRNPDLQTDWRYVFREALSTIWYWRNQLVHGNVTCLPPPWTVSKEIISRSRKLELSLLSLVSPDVVDDVDNIQPIV